ncbi:hypothetical protein D3C87_1428150 [compost metagenome]
MKMFKMAMAVSRSVIMIWCVMMVIIMITIVTLFQHFNLTSHFVMKPAYIINLSGL